MINKSKNMKAKAFGGLGIAVFLCLLMALMPYSGVVENNEVEENTSFVEETQIDESAVPLREKYDPYGFDAYDPLTEQVGMRDMHSKTYSIGEGKLQVVTSADPVHYMEDGTWQDIDMNFVTTEDGWEVTSNVFETTIGSDVTNGVSVDFNSGADEIITGINPRVSMLGENVKQVYDYKPFQDESSLVETGGNMLRYNLGDGFSLDYTVTVDTLKQDLVIEERPMAELLEGMTWFGLTEEIVLPVGYGLFIDGNLLGEGEFVSTQSEITIAKISNGEVLSLIPEPTVELPMVEGEEETEGFYLGTFFVSQEDGVITISTMVEVDWLLAEDRVFPIKIDPSLTSTSTFHGYCRTTYNYCGARGSTSSYTRWGYGAGTYDKYTPWIKFSAPAIVAGSTVDDIELKIKLRRSSNTQGSWSSQNVETVIMQDCGTTGRVTAANAAVTCTTNLIGNSNLYPTTSTYWGGNNIPMTRSVYGSDAIGSAQWFGLGISGSIVAGDICNTQSTCSAANSVAANVADVYLSGGGTVGAGFHFDASKSASSTANMVYQSYGSANYVAPQLILTYTPGADNDAPTMVSGAYDGVDSYVEGKRTFFAKFSDASGINSTSGNEPTLSYSIGGTAQTPVAGTPIGTCSNAFEGCWYSAQTVALSAGDTVSYEWSVMDTNSTPNTATIGPYSFDVLDPLNAPSTDRKYQVLSEDVNSDDSYNAATNGYHYDRQMTYWEGDADEYLFEWDTSECGTTTTTSCFDEAAYGGSVYNPLWRLKWQGAPNVASVSSWNSNNLVGELTLNEAEGGPIDIDNQHGPGMGLLFAYDTGNDNWAIMGIGDETGISERLNPATATIETTSQAAYWNYYDIAMHRIPMPADVEGTFGEFDTDWTGTNYQTTKANWMCHGSHGYIYFFRTTGTSPLCYGAATYVTNYKWSGFALGLIQYQNAAGTYQTSWADSKIAPDPDTFEPSLVHAPLADSHSKSRTFTFTVNDNGNPPSGIDVGTVVDQQPTLYYSINGGTWESKLLTPEMAGTACASIACDWTYTLSNLDRGDNVSYYATARDTSTVGGASGNSANVNTTSTYSFEVADPNLMFVVEWHDMSASSNAACTFQAVLYDTTNEIEFKYSDECTGYMSGGNPYSYYNKAITGYQDQTRTHGDTIRDASTPWDNNNPHTSNFRITTGANGAHGWETFDRGLDELEDYDSHLEASGSNGASGFYCTYPSYWNSYKDDCYTNIDMPDNFYFNYFGTEYNGSDNDSRVHISRLGMMQLYDNADTTVTSNFFYSWYNNMIVLPKASGSTSYSSYGVENNYVQAASGAIAPYWHRYVSNLCYDNAAYDCSVRTRLVPFEGKGIDLSETQWGDVTLTELDSPVRISPSSGDYLSFRGDITVEPGVVFQVAAGKGISFDGSCTQFSAVGNDTDRIVFEGTNGQEWKGLAFTGACATPAGTDDRHAMMHVDFKNTSDAAIAAGSRHGNYNAGQPVANGNTGNFTMFDITFDNVAEGFKHGSGAGTVIEMTNYSVSNADHSCFDFAKDTEATLTNGTLTNCNTQGVVGGGAIVSDQSTPSTAGSLTIHELDVTNTAGDFINVDFTAVHLVNVTSSATSTSGYALMSAGSGTQGNAIQSEWCGAGNSCTHVENFDVTGFSSGIEIHSITSYALDNVDVDGNVIYKREGTGIAAGPTSVDAVIDGVSTSGNIHLYRTIPMTLNDISAEDLIFYADAPSGFQASYSDVQLSGELGISGGCSYNIGITDFSARRAYFDCPIAGSDNNVRLAEGTIVHTVPNSLSTNVVYARHSSINMGETDIESLYVGGWHWSTTNVVAYASAGANIRLFDVSLNDDDNQDGTLDGASSCTEVANCPATVFGGTVWYGGVAEVTVKKQIPVGTGPFVDQPDHYVTANYIDSATPTVELFPLGLTTTNATGVANNVWVLIRDHNGNTATMHGLHAFGPGGVADLTPLDAEYPGCADANNDGSCDDPSQASFGAGDNITLYLEPEPVDLTAIGPGPITCQELGEHEQAKLVGDGQTQGYDPGETFTFAAKVTLNSDMMLEGCNIVAKDQFKLTGTGSFTPTLTIGSTSTFTVIAADGTTGDLRSTSALTPGHVVVLGELIVTNGRITNLAYDANTGVAIDIGADATFTSNGGTITGLGTNSPTNILVRIGEDAIADIDGGSIIAGGAGVGLQFNEASTVANADNFTVKNADIGIDAVNANPSIWNYNLENNEVGLNLVNNPPPPPPPPLCILGGPGIYYGGYWGSPLTCTFNLPVGEEFELKVEQYGWGSETSVDVTKPDGTTQSFGPYYFSSYTTYDPLETYDVAGQYTIVLDDTYGDGGARVTADYASDGGSEIDAGEVCSIGGTAWNPGFGAAGVSCIIPDGADWAAPRSFSLELTTYSWAGEAYWKVEQSLDQGTSWTQVGSGGPYAYSNYQIYDLGTFTGTGRFRITNQDTYGDGGQKIVATLMPAASNLINFNEGEITGSDTGVTVGGLLGEATVGSINNLNITGSGSSTGFEVVGDIGGIIVDGLEITGGDTGIDVSSTSSGAISFSNVKLNETTGTALHYQSDMAAPVTGTFGDNTGTAIKHGQFTTSDRTYDSLDLSGNAIGMVANGAGNIMITNSDFDNTMDVKITGSSIMTFVDGTVNEDAAVDQIDVSGSGMFERARALDYTYTADQGSGAEAVEEANVILLDADYGVASMGETDSSGEAGLLFNVYTIDKNGQDDKNLNGYTVATVAKIFTSTTVEDYRYAMTSVSLNDAPANAGTEELTQNIDARVCDTSNSGSYHHIQVCEGWGWSSYEVTRDARADGTGGSVTVYDYYNGIGSSGNIVDWSNKVVMLDSYRTYLEDTTYLEMTGATLLQTGGYVFNDQNYHAFWTTYPYQSSVTMEDTTFISLAVNDDEERLGLTLGQANTMDLFINNTVLNGIAGIPVSSYPAGPGGGAGNPNWEPEMEITNSTISFYEPMEVTGSTPISALHDICVMVGAPENTVSDNTFIDCPVGVMVGNYNSYYIANYPIEAGSRSVIANNEFIDTTGLDVWFTFFSYGEDVEIKDNEFKGTYPTMYGVYAQSQYSSGQVVTGNTFNNTLEPIYMRGSTDWTISQNTINGVGDASYAGIYELDGYGVISDNTLIDADGGILVDGVTSPPPQNVNLCTIGRYSYSTFNSCSFALPGSDVTVDMESDYWSAYEGSAKIFFPDGTEASYTSIPSNSDYTLATILASDWTNYVGQTVRIEVYDSYGDGGQGIDAYYVTGGAAASGVVITGNDISTSATRTAPSAVGIWIENCVGAAGVTSESNSISVIENAIVANGCDINDKDSVLAAAGGSAGSTYSVDINGDYYSPENTTVEAGDSVRWRSIDYYDSDNDGFGDEPHDVVSVDVDANGDPLFTTGSTLNLGSSFVHQFTTVGTYEYYCSVHPLLMRGNITVNPLTSTIASTAINVLGSLDEVTLDGTTVSGFGYAMEMSAGAVHLTGDADLSGTINAISAEDSTITVDGAHLSSSHPTGTAMVVTGDSEMNFVDLSVSGFRGLDTDLDFNWNGGISTTSDATVITAATGAKIENMTWIDATTQIHARSYARVLSVANSLDNSKLVVAPSAVIDEGNLFNLEITDDGVDTITDVGLAIQSTDDNRAEYASDAFRSGQMSANGDMSDWFGEYDNANAIFDDAMPGLMSTDQGHKVYTTWDNDNLYLAMTGADFDTVGDLEIYFDTRNTGTSQLTEGINSNDNLPFNADFAFVASDNANYGLKVPTILSGWVDLTSCTGLDATIGTTSDSDTEIAIPWDCLDADGDEIRVLAFVKTGGSLVSAHPDATSTNQNGGLNFTDSLVLRLPSDDVQEGEDVEDHILIYRSYVGSIIPSDPKSYDVVVKIPATCAEDWTVVPNVDVSATETFKQADIERACPDFTGLGDLTVNEDSGMTQYNLLNYGTDVQDDDDSLTWTVVDSAQVGLDYPSEMLTYSLAGQLFDVAVVPDAHTEYHGAYNMVFEVCDSHGLCVEKPVAYNINNINDKPIINDGNTPTIFEITVDGTTWTNYRPEAGLEAGITFQLGNTADNGTNGLIWDMYDIDSYGYEPNQVYTWSLNAGSNCAPIMTVEIQDNKELVVTEVAGQEVGGNCTLTLGLSDGFDAADDLVMDLAIYPENDPVDILEWKSDNCYVGGVATDLDSTECDAASGTMQQAVIADLNGNVPVDEWKITVTEDDESTNNLTFDLSKMKFDRDHESNQLEWTLVKLNNLCDYSNYFDSLTIVNDQLIMDLTKDATTTLGNSEYDIDYFNDQGVHQIAPASGEFCTIGLLLEDTENAPAQTPNYDMDPANYEQSSDYIEFGVKIMDVPESVPDFGFEFCTDVTCDEIGGFNFYGVDNVMKGTEVPTTVTINHGGNDPTANYNYDMMIEVCVYADTEEFVNCDYIAESDIPYGSSYDYTTNIVIEDNTTEVRAEMDVLTCVDEVCDTSKAPKDRFWQYGDLAAGTPEAHRCTTLIDGYYQQQSAWSCPGKEGYSDFYPNGTLAATPFGAAPEQRSPMLEDRLWCNNLMSTNGVAETCNQIYLPPSPADDFIITTNQSVPQTVDLIGSAAVPSFAPGMLVVGLVGMFVSALVLSSRREEEEEEMEENNLIEDEAAVSPVIATILMVAITVVLSGVVYVWAASLADTSAKGVPQFYMVKDSENALNLEDPYYSFTVQTSQVDLATQSMVVTVFYTNASGGAEIVSYNLADTTVYGFNPTNSDSLVTFGDKVEERGAGQKALSTFNTGDVIFVKTITEDGYDISDGFSIQVAYAPIVGGGSDGQSGALLATFDL